MGLRAVSHGVHSLNGENGNVTLTSTGGTVIITEPTTNTINLEASGGGGNSNLGTSAASANPARSGEANTGLYTAGSGLVDVTSLGTQIAEFSSAGLSIANGNLSMGLNAVHFTDIYDEDMGIQSKFDGSGTDGIGFFDYTAGSRPIIIVPQMGWIDMPTDVPSGIGTGGSGNNPWIAYSPFNGAWFSNAKTGDVNYRNQTGSINFGLNDQYASMQLVGSNTSGYARLLLGGAADDSSSTLQVFGNGVFSGSIFAYSIGINSGANALYGDGSASFANGNATIGGYGAAKFTGQLDLYGISSPTQNFYWVSNDAASYFPYNTLELYSARGGNGTSAPNMIFGVNGEVTFAGNQAFFGFADRSTNTDRSTDGGMYKDHNVINFWNNTAGQNTMSIADNGDVVISRNGYGTYYSSGASTSNMPGKFTVINNLSSKVASIIRAASSQSADLTEWQNSSGTVLTKIDASGLIFPLQKSSAPTYVKGAIYYDTTLNKLRVGGASTWETVTSV